MNINVHYILFFWKTNTADQGCFSHRLPFPAPRSGTPSPDIALGNLDLLCFCSLVAVKVPQREQKKKHIHVVFIIFTGSKKKKIQRPNQNFISYGFSISFFRKLYKDIKMPFFHCFAPFRGECLGNLCANKKEKEGFFLFICFSSFSLS